MRGLQVKGSPPPWPFPATEDGWRLFQCYQQLPALQLGEGSALHYLWPGDMVYYTRMVQGGWFLGDKIIERETLLRLCTGRMPGYSGTVYTGVRFLTVAADVTLQDPASISALEVVRRFVPS